MPTPEPPSRVDAIILTALQLEFKAVLEVDDGASPNSQWLHGRSPNGLPVAFRTFLSSTGQPITIALTRAADMGPQAATNALLPLANSLAPKCIAMCGVCAGRPHKTSLGDVIAAERLYYTDTGKQLPTEIQADLTTYKLRDDWKIDVEDMDTSARQHFQNAKWFTDRPLDTHWRTLRALIALRDKKQTPWTFCDPTMQRHEWASLIASLRKQKLLPKTGHEPTPKAHTLLEDELLAHMNELPSLSPAGDYSPFRIHVAPMGSGQRVIEDERAWAFISKTMRKTLGLEMEAAALGEIAHRQRHLGLDAIVMKGVMDFANHGRDDHYKEFAARASAECLLWFLRDHLTPRNGEPKPSILTSGTITSNAPHKTPSQLLNARLTQVPWHRLGRETTLAELDRWADDDTSAISVRLLHAEGGFGKTRLAIEWTNRLRRNGYTAGFLSNEPTQDWLPLLDAATSNTVVIIDYAELRLDLAQILTRIHSWGQNTTHRARLRLLLIARTNGTWWSSLRRRSSVLEDLLATATESTLPPIGATEADRQEVFKEAVLSFSNIRKREPPRATVALSDPRFERPLYIHMAALAAVEGISCDAAGLTDAILGHEERFWSPSGTTDHDTRLARDSAALLLTSATLWGGLTKRQARTVFQRIKDRALSAEDDSLALHLHDIYGRSATTNSYVAGLEPDLLGEGLVTRTTHRALADGLSHADLVKLLLPEGVADEATAHAFAVCARAAAHDQQARGVLRALISLDLPRNAPLAMLVEMAIGRSGADSALGSTLATVLESKGTLAIASALHALEIPYPSLALYGVARWVTSQLIAHGQIATSDPMYRLLLRDERARALDAGGHFNEAAQEEDLCIAELRGLLENKHPMARLVLIQCLVNSCAHLAHAHRSLDVIPRAREAVLLAQQEMAAAPSEEIKALLAAGLTSLGNAHAEIGNKPEGRHFSENALALYIELAATNHALHAAHCATAKSNLGNRFASEGNHEKALEYLLSAADDFTIFYRENPDMHLPEYARVLTGLLGEQMRLRLGEAARTTARKAEELHRKINRLTPGGALELAHTLQRKALALTLPDAPSGLEVEAISSLREAIALLSQQSARSARATRILHAASLHLLELVQRRAPLDKAAYIAALRLIIDSMLVQPRAALRDYREFMSRLLADLGIGLTAGVPPAPEDGRRVVALAALLQDSAAPASADPQTTAPPRDDAKH